MRRRRFHQIVFAIAGAYNLAWGAYSALDPQWLFRFANMPLTNHPEIFACLAMVIGIYGLLYWQVARDPEHGVPIAAIGLLGKVLGPIGLAQLIATGAWPMKSIVLCVTNDFIWWAPFVLYLVDARAAGVRGASSASRTSRAARG
ncbi:MAG TPA: hypothetical protein VJZ00_02030 [Thermoanaerobaculia bacterium]|nr:hypothetical protein [Thermoanaerobaculia bacterium]